MSLQKSVSSPIASRQHRFGKLILSAFVGAIFLNVMLVAVIVHGFIEHDFYAEQYRKEYDRRIDLEKRLDNALRANGVLHDQLVLQVYGPPQPASPPRLVVRRVGSMFTLIEDPSPTSPFPACFDPDC